MNTTQYKLIQDLELCRQGFWDQVKGHGSYRYAVHFIHTHSLPNFNLIWVPNLYKNAVRNKHFVWIYDRTKFIDEATYLKRYVSDVNRISTAPFSFTTLQATKKSKVMIDSNDIELELIKAHSGNSAKLEIFRIVRKPAEAIEP